MTEYEFPLHSVSALVERVDRMPPGAPVRRCVLRDDNQQHYHGQVGMADDPTYLELRWKPNTRGQEQLVGTFRLHLARLAAAGYIRPEGDGANANEFRLRFYRGERGVVYIQARQGDPALPIGVVDVTLG
jgi:hypothetical protein